MAITSIVSYPATQGDPFDEATGMAIFVECGGKRQPLVYVECREDMAAYERSMAYLRRAHGELVA